MLQLTFLECLIRDDTSRRSILFPMRMTGTLTPKLLMVGSQYVGNAIECRRIVDGVCHIRSIRISDRSGREHGTNRGRTNDCDDVSFANLVDEMTAILRPC